MRNVLAGWSVTVLGFGLITAATGCYRDEAGDEAVGSAAAAETCDGGCDASLDDAAATDAADVTYVDSADADADAYADADADAYADADADAYADAADATTDSEASPPGSDAASTDSSVAIDTVDGGDGGGSDPSFDAGDAGDASDASDAGVGRTCQQAYTQFPSRVITYGGSPYLTDPYPGQCFGYASAYNPQAGTTAPGTIASNLQAAIGKIVGGSALAISMESNARAGGTIQTLWLNPTAAHGAAQAGIRADVTSAVQTYAAYVSAGCGAEDAGCPNPIPDVSCPTDPASAAAAAALACGTNDQSNTCFETVVSWSKFLMGAYVSTFPLDSQGNDVSAAVAHQLDFATLFGSGDANGCIQRAVTRANQAIATYDAAHGASIPSIAVTETPGNLTAALALDSSFVTAWQPSGGYRAFRLPDGGTYPQAGSTSPNTFSDSNGVSGLFCDPAMDGTAWNDVSNQVVLLADAVALSFAEQHYGLRDMSRSGELPQNDGTLAYGTHLNAAYDETYSGFEANPVTHLPDGVPGEYCFAGGPADPFPGGPPMVQW